ncbi:2-dehydro-3-deoxygluconokinase [Paramesorhizobium deserti]|uniref:2-dehydro-3-deoxygluconokinase n=1 Tax=Paramesorhizobium deserti TaxID=1494590 RepID=A0A135HRU6_9HYPH|nr:sugar kinase [Paramesorhizobium deserti]KXF75894.1 2-dehydro-3-deoxygluconokinase [Paramesorhizobium deserti]
MTLDIIALGEPLIEFNQTRGQENGAHYRLGHGGDTSNAAIAAARQGASVGYVTALGADAFGDEFLKLWHEEKVDASRVIRDGGAHTGVYFVSHGPEGHVFSYLRAGSAASRLSPAALPMDYIGSAKYLHLSGISQAISATACDAVFAAIEEARANGVRISYDTNLRLKLWPLARARAISHATIPLCDVIFPSLEDATVLTELDEPQAIVDFYLRLGVPLVVLKLGPEGALVATGDGRWRVKGIAVETVDATGAGDTFDGAFLSMLVLGEGPLEAAGYANAAAALSTCGYGAVAPIPRRAEVLQFLGEEVHQ